MWAVYKGHGDIVQNLYQAGADLNIRTNDDDTVVMKAIGGGHGDIDKYLQQAGADINIKNMDGIKLWMHYLVIENLSGNKHVKWKLG